MDSQAYCLEEYGALCIIVLHITRLFGAIVHDSFQRLMQGGTYSVVIYADMKYMRVTKASIDIPDGG